MPTTNPRINVTLSPSLDSLVGQLASLQRVSKSSVLREYLEAVEPTLRQAVALMEAGKGASEASRVKVASDMKHIVQSIESTSHLAMQVAAGHTRDLVSEAQAIKGRRPGRVGAPTGRTLDQAGAKRAGIAAKGAARPPSSNRGVKS